MKQHIIDIISGGDRASAMRVAMIFVIVNCVAWIWSEHILMFYTVVKQVLTPEALRVVICEIHYVEVGGIILAVMGVKGGQKWVENKYGDKKTADESTVN